MEKPISDLHCHPSLKPNGNSDIEDIWVSTKNKRVQEFFKGLISPRRGMIKSILKPMATYSQSNLDNCYLGSNRLVFCSIYPFERSFITPNRPFSKSSGAQRFILKMIFGKKVKEHVDRKLIQLLTGISKNSAQAYLDEVHRAGIIDYYKDYKKEYSFLMQSNGTSSTNEEFSVKPNFSLVSNYEEYQQKSISPQTICGILSVEGMHAIVRYRKEDLFDKNTISELDPPNKSALENEFKNHIQEIKTSAEMPFVPFFITFSHHFNNLIAGHAKSFADAPNRIKPGFADVFDQKNGINLGISPFGKELIKDHILSRDNGQRILIDTKHMSLKARDDIFEIAKLYKANLDPFPLICSHTAVNGLHSREAAANQPDINRYEKDSYVSKFDINLTDQDIEEIWETDGLIGICMHDGRMPGGKFKKYFKKISGMFRSKEAKKRVHAQMFLTNIFHIAKVNLSYIRKLNLQNPTQPIDEREAWKTISLGTDNDGIVDPFDHFNTAERLREFRIKLAESMKWNSADHMKKYKILSLPSEVPFTEQELLDIMQGFSPKEITDRVFYESTREFLSKYFTEGYLKGLVV